MIRKAHSLIQRVDPMHEEVPGTESAAYSVKKPLAFVFDFLELFSARAEVTAEMSARGWSVGPPIHKGLSPAYDAKNLRLIEWVFFLIENDRVRAMFLSLPSFSSHLGFLGSEFEGCEFPSRDWVELCRGLAILLKARRSRVCIVAALPAPAADKPSVLRLWKPLVSLGANRTLLSLCSFGSPFRRDTVLFGLRVSLDALARPCECCRKHSQVRGRRAKRGPTYPWLFAYQVAQAFSQNLCRISREDRSQHIASEGLERMVPTDLALSLKWSPLLVWEWKSGVHINILESSALVRLYTWVALTHGRARFVNLCDSFVAQAALGKGRSSSPGLRHVTRRSGTVCLAAGLYPGNMYCPTRAMPADHPTRDAPMPPQIKGFGIERWSEEAILRDAERPRLRRWAANWCRLTGLLAPSLVLGPWSLDCVRDAGRSPHTYGSLRDFDASLGFPGEGPASLQGCWSGCRISWPFGLVASHLFLSLGCATHAHSVLGCNSLVQGPSSQAMFARQLSATYDRVSRARPGLGCNSLVQGPSTRSIHALQPSSFNHVSWPFAPCSYTFSMWHSRSGLGCNSLVQGPSARSTFALRRPPAPSSFTSSALCSAAGLGCNSLVQGPSTRSIPALQPSSFNHVSWPFAPCSCTFSMWHSRSGLGCNSLVQGPSARSTFALRRPPAPSSFTSSALCSAAGLGCNSLVQGPSTRSIPAPQPSSFNHVSWPFAPCSYTFSVWRSRSGLGCNSLVQGPSARSTFALRRLPAPSSFTSSALRSAAGLGCNSLVQGPSSRSSFHLHPIVAPCVPLCSEPQALLRVLVQGFFRACFPLCLVSWWSVVCLGLVELVPVAAMDAAKSITQADRRKARAKAPLLDGRPVQALTRDRRSKLKASWIDWLAEEGCCWDDVGRWAQSNVGRLNEALARYGRWLYEDGWPYYWFSETINMVSSEFPIVRRSLQQAWDLALAWQREEPPTHHSALPWQVLAAVLSVAITWGWTRVAGVIALAWGGLARIGEVLAAKRKHLVLPEDTGDDGKAVYLSVMEPKTRFRAARHQCLKVDQPQLVRMICLAFGGLGPEEKLWLMSPSTMRARFDKLLTALKLTRSLVPGVKDFDLGSLRAGGATWMMQVTESPDLVRRRGRWISNRVMEIYVQEISALMYLPRLPSDIKEHIYLWANSLNSCLDAAAKFSAYKLSPCHWHSLLRQGVVMP